MANVPEKRTAVAEARKQVEKALHDLAAGVDGAVDALAAAQGVERTARETLRLEIQSHLAPYEQQPGGEIGLLATEHPIVLLPVRIETRFDLPASGRPYLRVRVYPDEIFADDFEEELTREEAAAGTAYWEAGAGGSRAAWDAIASQFGSERAAWIIKATREPAGRNGPFRPESWNRAVEARLLPDRWIVLGDPIGSSGEPMIATSLAIREPLALTLNPTAALDPNAPAGDDEVDEDVRWTIDYAEARAAGMAIDLELDKPVGSRRGLQGFSQLLVLGVKSTLTAQQASAELARLFAGHRFGRGFEFVRQGTPTNNMTDRPSGYPPPDRDDEVYRVEAEATRTDLPEASHGGDGARFLQYLGLDTAAGDLYETWRIVRAPRWEVQRVNEPDKPRVEKAESQAAAAMNRVLWPGTWGYYLQHMMHVTGGGVAGTALFTAAQIEDARTYFIDHVRGRGPLPAFRIGGTPYGVLPISTLDGWVPASYASSTATELPDKLRRLRDHWRPKLAGLPRINRDPAGPDADLIHILGQEASSREVRVRPIIGQAVWYNLLWLLRQALSPWTDEQRRRAREVFGRLGEDDWFPRVARTLPWAPAHRFKEALVGPEPLSDVDGPSTQAFDYLHFLGTRPVLELRDDHEHIEEGKRPKNLIYRVLRHAVLVEYVRLAWHWVNENKGPNHDFQFFFLELHNIFRTAYKSVWTWLQTSVPGSPLTLGSWLMSDALDEWGQPVAIPGDGGVVPPILHRQALRSLGELPDAELERVFTEALDLCTYRLDAWITSLYTERLHMIRNPPVIIG